MAVRKYEAVKELPGLDPVPELQADPGQSPFRMKGVGYQGFLEYVKSFVPGGVAAVERNLYDPRLVSYLHQPFLSASWYDFPVMLHFLAAASAVCDTSTTRFVAKRVQWQIDRDMRGIYKSLLSAATPDQLMGRISMAFDRYFDFATVEVESSQPGEVITRVRGLPEIFVPWYKVVAHVGAETVLWAAGARDLRVEVSAPEP